MFRGDLPRTKAILSVALLSALALLFHSCRDKKTAQPRTGDNSGKYNLATGDEVNGGEKDEPRYAEAQEAMAREDWQAAIRLLDALTAERAGYGPYWNDLGVCLLKAGAPKKANDAFARALAVDPGYFKARFNQGVLLAAAGDDKGAEKAYRDALRINGDYGEALYNLGLLQQRQERWDEAEESYQKALKTSRSARLYKARYNLGVIAARRNDWPAAIKHYEQTILMNQGFLPAYLNLGVAQLKCGHPEAAAAELEKAIRLDPSHSSGWVNLGIAYARLERYNEAVDAMRRACALAPDDGKAVAYLARYLDKIGRAEEAAAVCEKALKAGVKHPELFTRLARLAADRKDDRLAIQYYQQAVQLDPAPKTYYNLGLAFRRQNNMEEAAKAYETAVRLDPKYAKAWLDLGYAYMDLGRFDESRKSFEKSLALQPGDSNALDGLKDLEKAQKTSRD